jgi:hypothetical protein
MVTDPAVVGSAVLLVPPAGVLDAGGFDLAELPLLPHAASTTTLVDATIRTAMRFISLLGLFGFGGIRP